MILVLFGPPGAGKGTQSQLLVERDGMIQISTGDLFREAIRNETALGKKAKSFMDAGQLVPDEVVIGLVEEQLQKVGDKDIILDGFPRTVAQAEALEAMLADKGQSIDKVVFLDVDHGALIDRITGRRIARGSGAVYHIKNKPPKVPGKCDVDGSELYQRDDDKEDVVKTRLGAYTQSTSPLKEYYGNEGKLKEVSGSGSVEDVYQRIKGAIA